MTKADHETTVKKANETIGAIPKSGKITAPMKKFHAALQLVAQKQQHQTKFKALLTDLTHLSGLPSSNHEHIADIVKRISDISEWNIDWQEQGEVKVKSKKLIRLIDKPEFIDVHGNDARRGTATYFQWEFDERIRGRILNPINFWTKINLSYVTKLRLGASINLYEIACQYESNHHGKSLVGSTGKKSLHEFWVPALLSEARNEYVYAIFKRDILTPAVNEINKETNLTVEVKEFKEGRKVVQIELLITNKYKHEGDEETAANPNNNQDTMTLQVKQMLLNWGINENVVSSILLKYDDSNYIIRHFEQAIMKERGGYAIKNRAKYLAASLKNNFVEMADQPIKKSHQSQQPYMEDKPLEQTAEQLQKKSAEQLLKNTFEALDEASKADLEAQWLQQCTSSILKSTHRAAGLNSKIIQIDFFAWLGKNPDRLPQPIEH